MASPRVVSPNPSQEALRVIDISRVARPFRFVSLANYFMMVTCIWATAGMLEMPFTTHMDVWTTFFTLLAAAVYAYAGWVAWHNIGVLGALINRHTNRALWVLGVFITLMALSQLPLLRHADFDSEAGKEAFMTVFLAAMLAGVVFMALFALAILRRRSMPGTGMKLSDFLRQSLSQAPYPESALPPRNPKVGRWLLIAGALWILAFSAIPDSIFYKSSNTVRTINMLGQVAFVFFIYARQFFQPDFGTVTAADKRAPVLFLRSFADDEKVNYQAADHSLFDFSLESRLAGHFNHYGPFIAVGAPKDKLPHLGAVRAQLSDDEWQGTVTGWMKAAGYIVLMAGTTHWVGWELKKVLDLGQASKLMVLFPQATRRLRRKKDFEGRLGVVRGACAGTVWQAGLSVPLDARRIRSVVFDPAGQVTVVTSRPRNRESFHLAALLAQQFIDQRGHQLAVAVGLGKDEKSTEAQAIRVLL